MRLLTIYYSCLIILFCLVNCPIGTYYNVIDITCVSCSVGFYQDLEAQFSCKACPEHKSTALIHARGVSECKGTKYKISLYIYHAIKR